MTMTPAARTLGRHFRLGYAAILIALACGLGISGSQIRALFGQDVNHSTMVNEAGRQRFLGVLTVHLAILGSQDPTTPSGNAFAATLAAWLDQQRQVAQFLDAVCERDDALCSDFEALRTHQLEIGSLSRSLARSAASTIEQRRTLEGALRAYLGSADIWVAELSDRFAAETRARERLMWTWFAIMVVSATAVVVFILEPIIRRLQHERTRFDIHAEERERLATVVEAMRTFLASTSRVAGVGGWELDIESSEVVWSDETCRIHGVHIGHRPSLAEALDYYTPESRPLIEAAVDHAMQHGEGWDLELPLMRASGEHIWVRSVGEVEFHNEQPVKLRGAVQDVTARKLIEEKTHEDAAELRRLNIELDQFVYAASHDLRAPLRAVEALVTWIEEDDPGVSPQTGERLKLIHTRVQRMSRMLIDILEYARVGRHGSHVGDPMTAAALTDEVMESMGLTDRFKVDIHPGLHAVMVTRMPFAQVMHNLLGNALKHHDLEVGVITVTVLETPQWFRFTVTDDGPGVPESCRARIFDMFTTLKPRDQHESSGMGLAIVKKIVDQQGARCGVDVGSGRGASFWFEWPKRINTALAKVS